MSTNKKIFYSLLCVCLLVEFPQVKAKNGRLQSKDAVTGIGTNQTRENQAAFQSDSAQYSRDQEMLAKIRELLAKSTANPNDGALRLQLVSIFFAQKMYRDVITEGERTLSFFPERPSLYYQIGESYRQLGNIDSAYQRLFRGYKLKTENSPSLSASYGMILLRIGRTKEGTAILQDAVKSFPSLIDNRIAEGQKAYNAGKIQIATDEFNAVLVLDPKRLTPEQISFVEFNINFIKYLDAKNIEEAVNTFEKNLSRKFGDKLHYDEVCEAFRCLVSQKQVDYARSFYMNLIRIRNEVVNQDSLDRAFFAVANDLGYRCSDLGAFARAAFKRVAKSHLEMSDTEIVPLYVLYDLTVQQGEGSITSEITSSVLNSTNSSTKRFTRLADLFLHYNRSDDAIGIFKIMLQKTHLDKLGYSDDLTQVYAASLKQSKTDEAHAVMNQLESLNANSDDLIPAYTSLVDVFTKAGKQERSIFILNRMLAVDPSNTIAVQKLGEAYSSSGRYDEMIASFLKAKSKEAKRFLSVGYEKKYMLEEANQAWKEFLALTNDPKEVAEAKERIRQNFITMNSPNYTKLRLSATKKLAISIDYPKEGAEIAASTVDISGSIVHSDELTDVLINGLSVGKPRGMKIPEAEASRQPATVSTNPTSFTYSVSLVAGSNQIHIEVVTVSGDKADASINVLSNPPVANIDKAIMEPMTGDLSDLPLIRQNQAYAVIIGVANYKDPLIPKLKYTVNDAKALYDLLTDPLYGGFKPGNVKLLVDDQATTQNIKAAIGTWLPRTAGDNATVIIYFAGHGAPEGDQTYWCTYDANINDLYSSSLSNNDIADMLKRVNTNRVLTFLDCCYSAATVNRQTSARAIIIEDPFKQFKGEGRLNITASDGKQQSLEDDAIKHGIFTNRLIEGLKGKADKDGNGVVMVEEAWDYLRTNVVADARSHGHIQTPTLGGSHSGEIALSRNPETAMSLVKTQQKKVFLDLFNAGKIDGPMYKRIKEIIEADEKTDPSTKAKKKVIKDYMGNRIDFETFLELIESK